MPVCARRGVRCVVVGGAVLLCAAATWRYHFVLHTDVVFSHLYYLPIALAGVWWGLRALPVALSLALYMLVSRLLSDLGPPTAEDLLRSAMLVVVGAVIGLLVRERDRLEREALLERERNLHQANAHLEYMARVSHELRNPLQVILGVADSLAADRGRVGRERLLELLDRSAENLRGRIEDLTRER